MAYSYNTKVVVKDIFFISLEGLLVFDDTHVPDPSSKIFFFREAIQSIRAQNDVDISGNYLGIVIFEIATYYPSFSPNELRWPMDCCMILFSGPTGNQFRSLPHVTFLLISFAVDPRLVVRT